MPNLAPIRPPGKKDGLCPLCGAEIQAVAEGKRVERCPAGTGNVALTPDLFGALMRAEVVRGVKTTFRFHRCRPSLRPSFTAAGMQRKQRPETAAGPARGARKGRS